MKIKVNFSNLKNHQNFLFIIRLIEEFLQKKGYLKIDLPVLSPTLIPESYLEVFETEFRYSDKREKLYLTPSPELFLKRLLVEGIGNCYYLGKSFRNSDPPSSLHSFEFMMLEFYKTGVNYIEIADEVLEMLKYISFKIFNKREFYYKNTRVLLRRWEFFTVSQAFYRFAGINSDELFDKKKFMKKAKYKGYNIENFSYEEIWSQIYTQEIEPKLGIRGFPTLIYNYPKEFAALAKLNPDGKTAQRFEFYINGIELGDCYTELSDWKEQEDRFAEEYLERKRNKKINHPIDKGFIQALKYGLPDCAGIAIGVERLAMVFLGFDSIDKLKVIDIIL
jgi:lysyl-tRNA synthetase class 2